MTTHIPATLIQPPFVLKLLVVQLSQDLDRIRFGGRFVIAYADDARETQRQLHPHAVRLIVRHRRGLGLRAA